MNNKIMWLKIGRAIFNIMLVYSYYSQLYNIEVAGDLLNQHIVSIICLDPPT